MLKIVYGTPYYAPYVLVFVVSLSIIVGVEFLLKRSQLKHVVGMLMGFGTYTLLVLALITLNNSTKAEYIRLIKHNGVPYYTYGKCDLDYETALITYGDVKQRSAPIVMYDVKGQGAEWNEIRKIENMEYTFIVYVSHLREEFKDVSTANKTKATITETEEPSYIDPRNGV